MLAYCCTNKLLTWLVKMSSFVSNRTLGRVQHKMACNTNSLAFSNMNELWVLIQENFHLQHHSFLHISLEGPPVEAASFSLEGPPVEAASLQKTVKHWVGMGADTTETECLICDIQVHYT